MCRLQQSQSTPKTAPLVWSSLAEHVIKTFICTLFLAHAIRSAQKSATTFSYAINSLIGLFALFNIKGQFFLAIKRLRRRLPPGYLGIPVYRDISFLYDVIKCGGVKVRQNLYEKRQKYGTFFSASVRGRVAVICGGQDDMAWLFNIDRKGLADTAWPPNIVMLLGPGSVPNQTGKYHRVLRRLLEPYFAPAFVNRNYLAVIDKTTREQLEGWSSSGEFLSSEVFKIYALRLFYVSAFGRVDEDVIVTMQTDFKLWLAGFKAVSTKRWLPGTGFDEAMKARGRILMTVDRLIGVFMEENPEESERAQTTIIGRLVYGKDKDDNRMMTRDEVKDNVLALIFAGHDTTFASISTLLYHLSQNPESMEELANEVSTFSEPLDSNELKNAPILNACLFESWRMDPPVMGGFRRIKEEVQHKGYSLDKDTVFVYSILMAVTDESLYNNHGKFNMRRFLPKDHQLYRAAEDSGIDPLQGRSNYPIFGGGTHACLGRAFAQLEIRVLATRILKHYRFEVRNPQKVVFPVNGWKIEFKVTKKKTKGE